MKANSQIPPRLPALRAAVLAVLFAWGFAGTGCNSPFIPVPPPADPSFTRIQDGALPGDEPQVFKWTVSAAAQPVPAGSRPAMANAKVFIFNRARQAGVIARADASGAYSVGPFEGALGDQVDVSYETSEGESSPSICRLLSEGTARVPCPSRPEDDGAVGD